MTPSTEMDTTPLHVTATAPRAWFGASIAEFLHTKTSEVLGALAANSDFAILPTQRDTWIAQIEFLHSALSGLHGSIFFEFSIPRMGHRVDVVLVIGAIVFLVEFKVGSKQFDSAAIDQVWDYALDLKYFHEESNDVPLIPILIATEASVSAETGLEPGADKAYRPLLISMADFRTSVDRALKLVVGPELDDGKWVRAPYRPTPTIVEAARSLYSQHSVDAIARYDAGAQNLRVTSRRIEDLVSEAKAAGQKIICFVTGVPGAGKILVGLNIATHKRNPGEPTHAVFLSGNGPLVAVLSEALTRDEFARQKQHGKTIRKGLIRNSVKAFIQNVHHFRDDALIESGPPDEHVVIFDEAQRAWNLRQTASFMRRKKKQAGFSQSEPEFLISYMDRHTDWAVIVCLVGGGQEINTGEAGIDAWLDALDKSFPNWHAYISANLTDSEYAAGKTLERIADKERTHFDDSLHLAVSMRSFRSEDVSTFVKALLDCAKNTAREIFAKLSGRYPIVLTRDLNAAKMWVRSHARGSERFGLVASSKAQRLKPHAIDIRVDVDPVHWFLNGKEDTRSSYYLEDAATEFQVQGLELDWACVSWDGDLRFEGAAWSFHDFRGDRWTDIHKPENKSYLRNAYRVLLTRARQGMALFVPDGDVADPTRSPEYYDSTFNYLAELGIPLVK